MRSLVVCFAASLPLASLPLASFVVAGSALAQTPPCSLEGVNLNTDPEFLAALHPSERGQGLRAPFCRIVQSAELNVGAVRLRVSRATLHSGGPDGPESIPSLVVVERLESAGARVLGRLVLTPDPLDARMTFSPQAVAQGGEILLRLAPRHGRLYRLAGDTLSTLNAFDWREALPPETGRVGKALSLDLETMQGVIALAPPALEAASLPSAFAPPKVARVALTYAAGVLTPGAVEIGARKPDEVPFLDEQEEAQRSRRGEIRDLPKGVEPCFLTAWSNDKDPKGLNVRAEPGTGGRVLGIVPPPRKMPAGEEAFGPEPVKAEFSVIGYRDGWFLIEDIKAPGVPYDVKYPRSLPQPYKGRGWVAAGKVGAAPAYTGLPQGQLYTAPFAEARSAEQVSGESWFGPDSPIARLHACTGFWGLIELPDGKRGWTRGLCANQVTNCS